jgi:hypothetical protein
MASSSGIFKIRDDEGDESAATKTVRLKAIQVIEGSEGKAGVVVNVNQQTNVAAITPGYVIRLPASRPAAIERPAQERWPQPNADPGSVRRGAAWIASRACVAMAMDSSRPR